MKHLLRLFLFSWFALTAAQAAPPTLEDLEAQEHALVEAYSALNHAQGHAEYLTRQMHGRLDGNVSEGDRAVLNELVNRNRRSLTPAPEVSLPLQPTLGELREINSRLKRFQDAYDAFVIAKTTFILERYHSIVEKVYADCVAMNHPGLIALERHRKAMQDARAMYYEILSEKPFEFGDPRRLSDIRPFSEALVQFWKVAVGPNRKWLEVGGARWESFHRWAKNIRFYLAVLPGFPRALWQFRNRQPFMNDFAPSLGRAIRADGYRNTLYGMEHLETPVPAGTARVITQDHAHWLLDSDTTTRLPLESARVYQAPSFWAPDWLTKLLVTNPQMVCVSMPGGGNPISRVLGDLKAGRCNTIFIQPEGSLSTGISFESRRPAENFSGILGIIRRHGFRIQLVPVSIPLHPRILNDHIGDRSNSELRSYIHPPLSADLYDLLMATGDPLAVSRLMRQHWLDRKHIEPTVGPRKLGSPPIRELLSLIDSYIEDRGHCSGKFLESVLGIPPEADSKSGEL